MRILVLGPAQGCCRCIVAYAPQRGGQDVKGGGHPADEKLTEEEDIDIGLERPITGHAKTPGIDDPGVPGSRTNPVRPQHKQEEDEQNPEEPVPPGTASRPSTPAGQAPPVK